MPVLIAYLLIVSLFVGAGYGTLHWLAEPAPVKSAAVHPAHRSAEPTFRDAAEDASRQSPQTEIPQTTASASPPQTNMSRETQATAPPVATSAAEPAAPSSTATTSAPTMAPPKSASAAATPPATAQQYGETPPANLASSAAPPPSAGAEPVAKPVETKPADLPAPGVAAANAPASDHASNAMNSVPNNHEASIAPAASVPSAAPGPAVSAPAHAHKAHHENHARVADVAQRRHLEAMTLRTVEFPDGSRRTFLVPDPMSRPAQRRSYIPAYDPYNDDDDD